MLKKFYRKRFHDLVPAAKADLLLLQRLVKCMNSTSGDFVYRVAVFRMWQPIRTYSHWNKSYWNKSYSWRHQYCRYKMDGYGAILEGEPIYKCPIAYKRKWHGGSQGRRLSTIARFHHFHTERTTTVSEDITVVTSIGHYDFQYNRCKPSFAIIALMECVLAWLRHDETNLVYRRSSNNCSHCLPFNTTTCSTRNALELALSIAGF